MTAKKTPRSSRRVRASKGDTIEQNDTATATDPGAHADAPAGFYASLGELPDYYRPYADANGLEGFYIIADSEQDAAIAEGLGGRWEHTKNGYFVVSVMSGDAAVIEGDGAAPPADPDAGA